MNYDKAMDEDWPYADPPNVAVITLKSITDRGATILMVTYDEKDGSWQFLDGTDVREKESEAQVVSLFYALSLDPTLRSLMDLPLGWRADRPSAESPWVRRRSTIG